MNSTELRATAMASLLDRFDPSKVMSDQEVEHFRHLFASIDVDGNGLISREELRALYSDEAEVDHALETGDINGDGQLSFDEMLQTSTRFKLVAVEQRAWAVFAGFDIDGDGIVERAELSILMEVDAAAGPSPSASMSARMLDAAIDAADGEVHYSEFLIWYAERQFEKG